MALKILVREPAELPAAGGRAVGAVLGCVLPINANTVTSAAEVTVLWLGPDEWLLVTNPGEEAALIGRLREALGDIDELGPDVIMLHGLSHPSDEAGLLHRAPVLFVAHVYHVVWSCFPISRSLS